MASLSGNLSLHSILSVLENDKKSISQGLGMSDVILKIFCKNCQGQ